MRKDSHKYYSRYAADPCSEDRSAFRPKAYFRAKRHRQCSVQ